jgi:VWFA-related protein
MQPCTSPRLRLLLSLAFVACPLFAQLAPRAQQAANPAPQESVKPTPQEPEEEVVRISSDLVQTDVMVFDKGGKFVDGLKPEQFELKVDGRPQQIVFFERIQAGTVNEDAQLAAARGANAGARRGEAVPLDRGRTVIFFVDDLHLSAGSSVRVGKTLLRYIDEEVGQNDEAAVYSASGQVGFLQQFTENKAVLRAAAARIKPRPFVVRDMQSPPMTEVQALAIGRNDESVIDYFVDAIMRELRVPRGMAEQMVHDRANTILKQSNAYATNTLASLYSLVRTSAALPGRKVLFFISDGFLADDPDSDLRDWERRVTDAAARSGVVIYSLDAQGLRTGQPDAASEVAFDPGGRLSSINMSETMTMQGPLFTLAADTGGRALVNTNALFRAVEGALKETELYYLLAWKPGASGGEHGAPKYQAVDVSVRGRPDLRVVVRRAFYGTKPPEVTSAEKKKKNEGAGDAKEPQKPLAEREMLAALRAEFPRGELPTALALNYVNAPNGRVALTASVQLDPSALTFEQGEKRRASCQVVGVLLDDNGKVLQSFTKQLGVTAEGDPTLTRSRVIYSNQFSVAPGLYQVRVAARDNRSGRTGSAMQWVEVPEFKQGQLSLSSIFIAERTTAVRPEEIKPEDMSNGVSLSVDRRFAHTSWIRFITYVYNAAGSASAPPDVALQVQILRDDQPVFTAPLKKLPTEGLTDTSRIPYIAELALESFPVGRYVLQITAIDRAAKASSTRRTNFIVE